MSRPGLVQAMQMYSSGGAAVQDFETASEVVGGDEVGQMGSKLFVAID